MADDQRRVELVGGRDDGRVEAARAGAGLLIGLVAGHRALLGAASGRTAFEVGLAYFVLAVLLSVGGSLFIGRMHDRFASSLGETEDGRDSGDDPDGDQTTTTNQEDGDDASNDTTDDRSRAGNRDATNRAG